MGVFFMGSELQTMNGQNKLHFGHSVYLPAGAVI